MLPLLLLLFIVVPIAELYVIIQVGQAIGVVDDRDPAADSIVGSLLMRRRGGRRGGASTGRCRRGRPPAREIIDGALVLLGGAFLLTPGFLSDILGLVLLLPPTRALVRRVLARRFCGRMTGLGHAAPPALSAGTPGRCDVDGTAHDVDAQCASAEGAGSDDPSRRDRRERLRGRGDRSPGPTGARAGTGWRAARHRRDGQGCALAVLFHGREAVGALAQGGDRLVDAPDGPRCAMPPGSRRPSSAGRCAGDGADAASARPGGRLRPTRGATPSAWRATSSSSG